MVGAGPQPFALTDLQEGAANRQAGDRAVEREPTQFQLPHHQISQPLQLLLLRGGERRTGLQIDHAEGAEVVPVGAAQRRPGVEADPRLPDHQGIGAESLIQAGIRHHHHPIASDGMGAEGRAARCLAHPPKATGGQEPLALRFHQRNRHNRSAEQGLGQVDQPLEVGVAGEADGGMSLKIPQPQRLIGRHGIGSRHSGGHGQTGSTST